MPGDHLSPGGVDLGAVARRQQQDAQRIQHALENAMHNPHTVHEHTTHAVGVADISARVRAIIVALPSGDQHRIHVDPQNARGLAEALGKPFAGESALADVKHLEALSDEGPEDVPEEGPEEGPEEPES